MILLPRGYVGLREAAAILACSMFAGVADPNNVIETRKKGFDVNDGEALKYAIAVLWKAVDQGKMRAVAIGGQRRRIVRIGSDLSKAIPHLRNSPGGDFTFLRPKHCYHRQFVVRFGPNLGDIVLAFRLAEIEKYARAVRRTRRKKASPNKGLTSKRGRPSMQAEVMPVITRLVERGLWHTTASMKVLTTLVNRHGKFARDVSQDTVTRALDALHQKTGNRQFERASVKQSMRPRPAKKRRD